MVREDELPTLIGKKILVRLGIAYLMSYEKDEKTGLYIFKLLPDLRDIDSIKTVYNISLSDVVKNPKATLSDRIIKYEELADIAYFQEPFFFIDLVGPKCGWTFVDKLRKYCDGNDSNKFKFVYTLKAHGEYAKNDYGKRWLAFSEEVSPKLIKEKQSYVDYSNFI